ncbi:MAG: TRAP transporter large permease subunit [Halopseudomonas sp.]
MTIAALFISLFSFMFIGIPVAISLGLSSLVTILLFSNDSLASVGLKMFQGVGSHYALLAVPFFLLSSAFLSTGGVARRLIDFATNAIGHVRGGLAMASVLACMLFAAVSGSSPATVAAIGIICIRAMVRAGYPESLAAGVVMNSGTLGILIPPSIIMLIYAATTEVSAARMFMAGFLPGIMIGLMLMIAIYIFARIKKLPAQPWPGFPTLMRTFLAASGGLMLIAIVLGTIYGGIASPTEAAAVSAVYAFIVAVFVYRDIGPLKAVSWRQEGEALSGAFGRNAQQMLMAFVRLPTDSDMRKVVMDASKVTIMLMFVVANAMLFAHVLTTERIPHEIAELMVGLGLEPWAFLLIMNLLLLAAGNFMEPSAIILIMAPILFPIAMQLGIDPIHLGIIMVVNMEIGLLTPPVGLNLFVAAGITGRSLGWAVRAATPWLLILLIALMLITFFPQISLFVPEYIDSLRGY